MYVVLLGVVIEIFIVMCVSLDIQWLYSSIFWDLKPYTKIRINKDLDLK